MDSQVATRAALGGECERAREIIVLDLGGEYRGERAGERAVLEHAACCEGRSQRVRCERRGFAPQHREDGRRGLQCAVQMRSQASRQRRREKKAP